MERTPREDAARGSERGRHAEEALRRREHTRRRAPLHELERGDPVDGEGDTSDGNGEDGADSDNGEN